MATERALDGRVAIVTGGSRGIGRGIALELAASGAAVAVNFRRDEESAAETVREIESGGGRAKAIQASVTERDQVDALAEAALAEFGHVDIVVSNAGIASRGNSIADTEPAELDRLMLTHAFSAARLAQLLLPQMRERPRGDFVMISSSEVTYMRAGSGPYNMAKSALEAMAMTMAKEEAEHGVHVNVVAPGLVATDMGDRLVKAKLGVSEVSELDAAQPFGRICRPEDIARVVRFLVSEDAGMVTGQRIVVDGGADAFPASDEGT